MDLSHIRLNLDFSSGTAQQVFEWGVGAKEERVDELFGGGVGGSLGNFNLISLK